MAGAQWRGGVFDPGPAAHAVGGVHPALLQLASIGVAAQAADHQAGGLHLRRVDARASGRVAARLHDGEVELALDGLEQLEERPAFRGLAQLLACGFGIRGLAGGGACAGQPEAAAGGAQALEQPAAGAARAVDARGERFGAGEVVAQRDASCGVAQGGEHRLDEAVVAALQDRRCAAALIRPGGEIAWWPEQDLVGMAHHMFPAPGV